MFKLEDAASVANTLCINFDKYNINDLLRGMNIELEHGIIKQLTNITTNDPILTAKIAIAHLNEFPNYYNKEYGISVFEQFLKERLTDTNYK